MQLLQGQGMSVTDAVRQIGVTVQTYDRWRRLYGVMGREQLRRLKEPETSQSDGRAASTGLPPITDPD
ncbi:MAG: helix-turn-helix domain-containing protein [Pseudomonadota bacterium]